RAGRRLAARHEAADLGRQVGDVEGLNAANAGFAVDEPLPGRFHAAPQRRDQTHAGDYDASHESPPSRSAKAGSAACGLLVLLDVIDRVLDGGDLLGGVIGDLAAEFFLEGHHELDRIEAVRAQIVDEACVLRDLAFIDSEMFDDDFFYPVCDVGHRS